MIRRVVSVTALVMLANFLVWAAINRTVSERAWGGVINSVSYSGYQAGNDETHKTDAQIDQDMAVLDGHVASVRTYGVSDGLDRVPAIAARHNLDVTLGAWISPNDDANRAEIAHAIDVARANPNVKRLVVGNESLLRADVTIEQLQSYLDLARQQINIPVTTAEPWHVWLKYPQLADSVDFITVHVLPYWEGLPEEASLGYVMYRYRQLATAFPNKHIFIGETGWPSEGQWVKGDGW